jgi:hypothetical protein
MSLDDIPCKFIISKYEQCSNNLETNCRQQKVRPYKRCNTSCPVSGVCEKYVNEEYTFEPCIFNPGNLSSCREPKGIPIHGGDHYPGKYGISEICISKYDNSVSFRINDYPNKNTISLIYDYNVCSGYSLITGIGGGWFGSLQTKFDHPYHKDKIKIERYQHSIYHKFKHLSVSFTAIDSNLLIFPKVINYVYKVTLNWSEQIMFADLYENDIKIDTSNIKSLRYI